MALGSRPCEHPDDHHRGPVGRQLLDQCLSQRLGPGHVMGTVEDDERVPVPPLPSDRASSPTRTPVPPPPRPAATRRRLRRRRRRRPRSRPDRPRGEADRPRDRPPPGSGDRSAGPRRPPGCDRRRSPGPGPRSVAAPTASAAARKTARSSRSISPTTSRHPVFMIPDFSVAMSSRVGPRTSTWS